MTSRPRRLHHRLHRPAHPPGERPATAVLFIEHEKFGTTSAGTRHFLLDYHRLEAGKMDLHPVAFNPHELLTDIYNSFLPLAEKKQLQLDFKEKPPETLTLEGDPFRIRQIVENLLSNALKFTAAGGITLQAEYHGNQFVFSISDTGCGMTASEQERIFKEFTRLSSAQGQEGFGLGLSITRKLVNFC
mgnify:CR=1 FL=1